MRILPVHWDQHLFFQHAKFVNDRLLPLLLDVAVAVQKTGQETQGLKALQSRLGVLGCEGPMSFASPKVHQLACLAGRDHGHVFQAEHRILPSWTEALAAQSGWSCCAKHSSTPQARFTQWNTENMSKCHLQQFTCSSLMNKYKSMFNECICIFLTPRFKLGLHGWYEICAAACIASQGMLVVMGCIAVRHSCDF